MLSAAHYALSNKRAEAAVKTAKRLLCNNTERGDMIDTNEWHWLCYSTDTRRARDMEFPIKDVAWQDSQGRPLDKPTEALIQGMDHGLP